MPALLLALAPARAQPAAGGTGDAAAGTLVLEEALWGRLEVRDGSGRRVAELRKEPAYPVQLGLPAGSYDLTLDQDGRVRRARLIIEAGRSTRLGPTALTPIDGGGGGAAAPPAAGEVADQAPTLVGRTHRVGGYAGFGFRYTRLGGGDGFVASPELGLLLDRRLSVGLLAGGGVSRRREGSDDRLALGYAQVFVRYHLFCDVSPLCFSLGAAGGAGGVGRHRDDEGRGGAEDQDALFLFEPQVAGHLTITRFLRVGVDVGYRLVAGADRYPSDELRGVAAGFNTQVGWF